MITIEADATKAFHVWPPKPGAVYSVPVENAMKIGDAFLWKRGDDAVQMQVIGLDAGPHFGKRVMAVLD